MINVRNKGYICPMEHCNNFLAKEVNYFLEIFARNTPIESGYQRVAVASGSILSKKSYGWKLA